jgi:hypothetical protein
MIVHTKIRIAGATVITGCLVVALGLGDNPADAGPSGGGT